MPMFEYACRACGHQFETLVRSGDTPECASCASTDLQKKLSAFATQTYGPGEAAANACGTCGNPAGPGACSLD
jgi:putative FmdB family regulatory protein